MGLNMSLKVKYWKGFFTDKAVTKWIDIYKSSEKENTELVVFEIPKNKLSLVEKIEGFLQKELD